MLIYTIGSRGIKIIFTTEVLRIFVQSLRLLGKYPAFCLPT
ncbi:hypothetical protein RVIR1_06910 [Candidatus Rickettsiella viridis]|uniref:Uncharacterized protein n=1 Tax=Candidatus Rickettsiella viridis TaxID=676208 RepID=A0A2Z5UUM1_9COXI|nr:hypothetical protein RVIR1_06910 [Candidatus Rickettsiella viridis]